MNVQFFIDASFILATLLFIYGLKRMSSPVTARSGIVVAGWGMVIAVVASFLYVFNVSPEVKPHLTVNVALAVIALALGLGWAWRSGKKVEMTAMPQMVALYNGMGGGAAAAIAAIELFGHKAHGSIILIMAVLGGVIGAVSLSGSLIAWGKLDGRINGTWRFPGLQAFNGLILLTLFAIGAWTVWQGGAVSPVLISVFFILALFYGVMMAMPIGGADMPVVISLFNAFTGLAVGFEGYVIGNAALMVAGMVVGSAGTLLTLLMAKAMNRSVSNVLFSNFGATGDEEQGEIKGSMKPIEAGDAGINMRYASKVIIAPGYGLAVAQAQHKLYEFVKILQAADVDVKFAIHPVAGRMPGHMNVLLAEAGVPYDIIYDMEDINGEFKDADVAIVIGANDTVNPAARTNKSSPIYGMPILNVDQAKQVYVVKRGQGKGYSGVENELFFQDNTNMVYGDAQKVLVAMVQAVKALDGGGH
jgi:H+-translocating NAD(P) transhydrogenase subunit beta